MAKENNRIQTIDVFGDVSGACRALARKDKALKVAIKAIDAQPKIRRRDGGYAGLFRIIVEQQVSVPSAQAILARCEARLKKPTPQKILKLAEEELRACGLSGPKIRYVRAAAEAIVGGGLCFKHLATLEDNAEAAAYLCQVKGIGPWTAAIYQLFCEGRVDIWPRGDVALLAAYAAASGFAEKPPMKEFDARADDWAPYRGIAAHVLWTYYAVLRGRNPI